MEFSYFELKQVATLKSHPGYVILMDSLKAALDDVTNQLQTATAEDETRILAKWRAYQEIYVKLTTVPEELALEFFAVEQSPEKEKQMPVRTFTPHIELTPEAEIALKAAYESKKAALKIV